LFCLFILYFFGELKAVTYFFHKFRPLISGRCFFSIPKMLIGVQPDLGETEVGVLTVRRKR